MKPFKKINMIDFPIPIVMVIVGSIYIMPENCKINHAPIYLLVGGTVYILCAIFRLASVTAFKLQFHKVFYPQIFNAYEM